MDRKLAEVVAKGTHTLSDSDSDITIDPDSPNRQELNSDADSDITVDESGEAEDTTTKDKRENIRGDGQDDLNTPLRKKTTMNIEELFGSDDSDGDQGKRSRTSRWKCERDDSISDNFIVWARKTQPNELTKRLSLRHKSDSCSQT